MRLEVVKNRASTNIYSATHVKSLLEPATSSNPPPLGPITTPNAINQQVRGLFIIRLTFSDSRFVWCD